jgi:hypothetical protein
MKEQNPKYHHLNSHWAPDTTSVHFRTSFYNINCNIILPSYCWSRSLGFSRSQLIPDDSIVVMFETSEFHSILTWMTARQHFMSCARCKRFKYYTVITSVTFHHKISYEFLASLKFTTRLSDVILLDTVKQMSYIKNYHSDKRYSPITNS